MVILIVGVAVASVASAGRSAPATRLHRFVGFQGSRITKGLTIQGRISGSCWTQSLVVGRPYGWRCMHGNGIYDPCFTASSHSALAVCPEMPWSRRVYVMLLTRPLPTWTPYFFNPRFPWGVWTTNGKRCASYAGSAVAGVAGRQVTYGCVGGGLLVGLADQRTSRWSIRYVTGWQARTSVLVGITDAWT